MYQCRGNCTGEKAQLSILDSCIENAKTKRDIKIEIKRDLKECTIHPEATWKNIILRLL